MPNHAKDLTQPNPGGGSSGSGSVVFDPEAADYDRTRALPRGVMSKVMALLRQELDVREPCLEIGVGTGRYALPLAAEGVPMVGVDLSPSMLRVLVDKAGGSPPFPLAVADATRLPFPDDSFGSGLVVHVLHLIPNWRTAVGELLRVVRPGGAILVDPGGWGNGWWREVQEEFSRLAGIEVPRPGLRDESSLDEAMRGAGATIRTLPELRHSREATLQDRIELLRAGRYSFTWQVPQPERDRVAGLLADWAGRRFGSLTEPMEHERVVRWRVYDLPEPEA
jgi:ubiquinone/menaquinone biosynthesis C-methylase UbiE